MQIPILVSLMALAACTIAPEGVATPEEAAASRGLAYAGEGLDAPATTDTIVCPGEFPDSVRIDNARDGVPEFFCD
jgi:hypothetical protein